MLAVSAATSWSFDPLQVGPILVLAALYWRRVHTLAGRGAPVPRWRQGLFATGIGLLLASLVTPLDPLGEEDFLWAHMAQHVILGDLAPLAIVAGLTGPVLRPVLAIAFFDRLRVLAHPFVALPLWAVDLYGWHLPFMYEAALHNAAVHAVEHVCFFGFGAMMWAPVVEVLPGPEWFGTGAKLAYIVGVRFVETILGNVFLWSGHPFYSTYDHAPIWGLSPATDQVFAGAVMMGEGGVVTLVAIAWLFLRMANEGELRQQLLESGLDPRQVRRAVRYGRAQELPGAR
ncbi:MAG TPA: cytochrome c oxidase assembly protein [Gaiellaceae bacterium]|nr:cytochrome c oxidase assembly protein [Gaiellaceae bacterium]